MWENRAMRPSTRLGFLAIFAGCAILIATAIFYFQEQLGLDPCPMCVLQRYAFILTGIVALVAAIHGPRGWGRKVYGTLIVLIALAGAGVAARHSYLQHFPPKVETCGSDLEFILNTFSLSQALPKIFAGTGSCSAVHWKLLGLSIPEWALVWFAVFTLFALWVLFRRRR